MSCKHPTIPVLFNGLVPEKPVNKNAKVGERVLVITGTIKVKDKNMYRVSSGVYIKLGFGAVSGIVAMDYPKAFPYIAYVDIDKNGIVTIMPEMSARGMLC